MAKPVKIKMKADGRIGFLTGKKKKKAGKTIHQIFFPWTKEDLVPYVKKDPNFRPSTKGLYDWQKEVMFDLVLKGSMIITAKEKRFILAQRKLNCKNCLYRCMTDRKPKPICCNIASPKFGKQTKETDTCPVFKDPLENLK